MWLLLAAVLCVYIVLGVLYESTIHPVTILSTLPSATLGALLALVLARDSLNVISLIGIILLIGIVGMLLDVVFGRLQKAVSYAD